MKKKVPWQSATKFAAWGGKNVSRLAVDVELEVRCSAIGSLTSFGGTPRRSSKRAAHEARKHAWNALGTTISALYMRE